MGIKPCLDKCQNNPLYHLSITYNQLPQILKAQNHHCLLMFTGPVNQKFRKGTRWIVCLHSVQGTARKAQRAVSDLKDGGWDHLGTASLASLDDAPGGFGFLNGMETSRQSDMGLGASKVSIPVRQGRICMFYMDYPHKPFDSMYITLYNCISHNSTQI